MDLLLIIKSKVLEHMRQTFTSIYIFSCTLHPHPVRTLDVTPLMPPKKRPKAQQVDMTAVKNAQVAQPQSNQSNAGKRSLTLSISFIVIVTIGSSGSKSENWGMFKLSKHQDQM